MSLRAGSSSARRYVSRRLAIEAWKGKRADRQMATRFPGVLLRLPSQLVEGYMTLGLLGLATHERFSLKTTCEFFVSGQMSIIA